MAGISIKDISSKQEGKVARFEFPDRIKDLKRFEEHLLAILYVNIQVAYATISRGSDRITIGITGFSEELDLQNFQNIIHGIANQH